MIIIISNDINKLIWKFKWKVAIPLMFSNKDSIVIIPYEFWLVFVSNIYCICILFKWQPQRCINT